MWASRWASPTEEEREEERRMMDDYVAQWCSCGHHTKEMDCPLEDDDG